jgi:hypothetical protein
MGELVRAGRRTPWLATLSAAALILAGVAGTIRGLPPVVVPAAVDAGSAVERSTVRTGCTVVYAADGRIAVGGNNEDQRNPLTRIWFVPGEHGGYGSVFVGYDDLVVQGGMNEAGLFFDGLGVREVEVPASPGKPTYTGQNFFVEVMSACDSVACVLEKLHAVSMPGTWNGQTLFGDRFGRSAILEPLTVIPKGGGFQVATNFFQSEVPPPDRTDERYLSATGMLSAAEEVSTTLIRNVLEATHQEGTVNTVYSTVYDLNARTIDLYYFHDFTAVMSFDLVEELAKGLHGFEMAELFWANRAAAERAAPIREEVAAAVARLSAVPVEPADLAAVAGTYVAPPVLTLLVEGDEHGLMARQPWTPWVPLVPLSPTEFGRVFSDAEELVHEQHLRFDTVAPGGASRVEITGDSGQRLVATRVPVAGSAFASPAVIVALAAVIAGAAAVWWGLRRLAGARRTGSPRTPTTPARPRGVPGADHSTNRSS